MFSILFVGFLALCCLIFAGISALGLTQEFRRAVSSVELDYTLPEWKGPIPKGVGKIIVQAAQPYGIKVDQTGGTELQVFGSYTSDAVAAPANVQVIVRDNNGNVVAR